MSSGRPSGSLWALGAVGAISILSATRKGARSQIKSLGARKFAQETLDDLAKDLEDLEGHYGKSSARNGHAHCFEFDIKAHSAHRPDWVAYAVKKLKHHEGYVWEVEAEFAKNEIENFVYDLEHERLYDSLTGKHTGPPNPDYAEWFVGEHHTAGRSGGYLLLRHDRASEDLERLSYEWGDHVSYLLGGIYLESGYEQDVREAVEKAERTLKSVEKIKRQICKRLDQYTETIRSDDFWQEELDLTDKKVKGFKEAMARETAAGTYRDY